MPLGTLEVSCFITLLVATAPNASAVTIDSFSAPFNAVLDNLMTNYWSSADNGDWIYDEHGPPTCGGYDAPMYSAELLYPLGLDTGNQLCTERANKTVDFVIDLVDPLSALVQRLMNGEDVIEEVTSALALIPGHRYYSGSSQYDFDTGVPALLFTGGYFMRQGYVFDPLNEHSGPGLVAYYQLLTAYNFRDKGELDFVSTMVRDAHDLLELADTYWVQVDEDTGYYDSGSEINTFAWGWMLQALALGYKASGRELYVDRARDLFSHLEGYWDDTSPYGYCDSTNCEGKHLSPNYLICRGLLALYDATGDTAWLDRAHEVLVFMTNPVVIYREDLRFPGYSILAHHWDAYGGISDCSCSGCNFAVLATIYTYNRLDQEGPGGVDPVSVCDDRIDNDGDGLDDYPDDPGCADALDLSEKDETGKYLCDDGDDNDGDTLIDYPADPGCGHPASDIENPQCQDGINNDPAQDGWIDFDGGVSAGVPPEWQTDPDPECIYAWEVREARPGRCGFGAELALLLPPLMWLARRRRSF
jgi:hypothetical protein